MLVYYGLDSLFCKLTETRRTLQTSQRAASAPYM